MAEPEAIFPSIDDVHFPAANTAAVVTYAGLASGLRHCLADIWWSYSAAPTAGRLTVTDGGTTVVDKDITAAGPDFIEWDPPRKFAGTVVITLAAGGGAVVGKLNVGHYTSV